MIDVLQAPKFAFAPDTFKYIFLKPLNSTLKISTPIFSADKNNQESVKSKERRWTEIGYKFIMKQPSAEIPKNMREECSQKGRTDEPEK